MQVEWKDSALRAFKHFGIDPESDRYHAGRAQSGEWCSFCHLHSENTPRVLCDLEKARAAEMKELGFEASCCFHCRRAYPKMFNKAAICPHCQRVQDARDALVAKTLRRRNPVKNLASSGRRIQDGLGCTEKVPGWTVGWDGNPDG